MTRPLALEFTTQLVVQEQWNGNVTMFPAADPKLACYGASFQDCLSQQRSFLTRYLAGVSAEVLAGFSFPRGATLHETEIRVAREDLPRRLQMRDPVSIASVVIPLHQERWVVVLPLLHTMHVGNNEDLDEAIRAEIDRVAAAREMTAQEVLELLPPKAQRLEPVTLRLELGEAAPEGTGRTLRKELADRQRVLAARKVLESVSTPLAKRAGVIDGPPILARESELRTLTALLGGRDRASVLILGAELIGKSALLWAWLRQESVAGRNREVFATSGSQLIAGMSGLGQWQERIGRVLSAAETLDAIVYFEDLGDLLAEHAGSRIDLPGAMKPFLEEGRVRLVGEMTPEELDRFEGRHAGFLSCLSRVRLEAVGADASAQALRERVDYWARREPDRPNLAPEAVPTLLDLVERYLPYQPLPGKAMRLYDELRASHAGDRTPRGAPRPIDADRVVEAFSLRTGIPSFLLREDRALVAEDLVARFARRLVGQEEAVRAVVGTLCMVKAGLQPTGKPLATFLFIGPTGVGKTELARLLAEILFGAAERMVRFDMSEYMDPFAAERLIRGTDSSDGLLTRKVREQPFCVLLLDEIEKAHPAVLDLLLQVFGEGRLTDARGKTAFFHNAILILTSNLGSAGRRAPIGIGAAAPDDQRYYLRQVQQEFRPELVNRIDRIIPFRPLQPVEIRRVAELSLEKIAERRGLASTGLTLDVDEAALAELSSRGYSEMYGARAMRRQLEDELISPLSRFLGGLGGEAENATIRARSEAGGLRFDSRRRGKEPARGRLGQTSQISEIRREVNRWMALDTIETLRDQLTFIAAQLSSGPAEPASAPDRRTARQVVELQTEYHRLNELWQTAMRLRTDLETVEELALSALFDGEDAEPFVGEAVATRASFRRHLVRLLLAQEPKRNGVSLMVQEAGAERAFDRWLIPLLANAAERRWSITVHADGDTERTPDWPAPLRWGPPKPSEWLTQELKRPTRRYRNLILRCGGDLAGGLLALEEGLHRWLGPSGDAECHMLCRRVAMRNEVSAEELALPDLQPAVLHGQQLKAAPAVREHDPSKGEIRLVGRKRSVEVDSNDYWQQFEQIALEHLLLFEESVDLDRESLFIGILERLGFMEAQ